MTAKTVKKTLFKDQKKINDSLQFAEKCLEKVQVFLDRAKQIGLEPTSALFNGFYLEGVPFIQKELVSQACSDFERLGIKSLTAKRNLIKGITADAKSFEGLHMALKDVFNNVFPIDRGLYEVTYSEIDVINGRAVIPEQVQEKINACFTVELDSPLKKELWCAMNDFAESYNKFNALCHTVGLNHGIKMFVDGYTVQTFQSIDDNQVKPNPMFISLL